MDLVKSQYNEKLFQLDGTSSRENNRQISLFFMSSLIKCPKVHVIKPESPYRNAVFEKYSKAICNLIAKYWLLGALVSIAFFVLMIIVALVPIFKVSFPFEMKFKSLDPTEKASFSHMRLHMFPNEFKPNNFTHIKNVNAIPWTLSHLLDKNIFKVEKNHSNGSSLNHLVKANKSHLLSSVQIKKDLFKDWRKINRAAKRIFSSKNNSSDLNSVGINRKPIQRSDSFIKRNLVVNKLSSKFTTRNQTKFVNNRFQDFRRNTRLSQKVEQPSKFMAAKSNGVQTRDFVKSQSDFSKFNEKKINKHNIERDIFVPKQLETNSFIQNWNRVPLKRFENLFF